MTHAMSFAEKFWKRVDVSGECWEWTGARVPSGYGAASTGRRNSRRPAHRVAWELSVGPIPAGLQVCHRCDNPPCVRPAHLFLGTQVDNMADARAKGRAVPPPHPMGENHHSACLSNADRAMLIKLRAQGVAPKHLGALFHVPTRYVYNITHEARKGIRVPSGSDGAA